MTDRIQMSPAVLAHIKANRKIEALKLLREETGMGLKDAKAVLEHEIASRKAFNPDWFDPTISNEEADRRAFQNFPGGCPDSPLAKALLKISRWIATSKSHHAQVNRHAGMRCGLTREQINSRLENVNFQLPIEICELFQWQDRILFFGDRANPVSLGPLDDAVRYFLQRPEQGFPIFIGGCITYFIDLSNAGSSEIRCRSDDRITGEYAPSLTALMEAIVECVEKHDGFSAYYMAKDKNLPNRYSKLEFGREMLYYNSLLDPIYSSYGIKNFYGEGGGWW